MCGYREPPCRQRPLWVLPSAFTGERELNPKWCDLKQPQLFILLPTLQFGQGFMGLASLCSVYGQQR